MIELEDSTDLVLVVGSSLNGEGHRLVQRVAEKAAEGLALGAVIINVHPTPLDYLATLRIFGNFDHVAGNLAKYLNMKVVKPDTQKMIEHKVPVPYDTNGYKTDVEPKIILDMTPGGFSQHLGL